MYFFRYLVLKAPLLKKKGKRLFSSESSGGVVVRALAFHQCGPGLISNLGVICGLNLFVLVSALRGFSPGTLVFLSPQKPAFD